MLGTGDAEAQKWFWDMESLGIVDEVDESGTDLVMSFYKETVIANERRYEVALSWKPSPAFEDKSFATLRLSN